MAARMTFTSRLVKLGKTEGGVQIVWHTGRMYLYMRHGSS